MLDILNPRRIDRLAADADVPHDGGRYYGTPPLRAELCIAGQQSDTGSVRLMLAPQTDTTSRPCPVVGNGGGSKL